MSHKVLLVDDEPNVLNGMRRVLYRERYEILTADSAEEALKILRDNKVDVVISDQDMPLMTGTELFKKVKTLYPDTVRFILTGKATLDVAINAINEGSISRFFTKPCNEIDLVYSIRQALQQKDLMQEARRLLNTVKKQGAILDELEMNDPGISKMRRDREGAIVIDDRPTNINDVLAEIRRELDK